MTHLVRYFLLYFFLLSSLYFLTFFFIFSYFSLYFFFASFFWIYAYQLEITWSTNIRTVIVSSEHFFPYAHFGESSPNFYFCKIIFFLFHQFQFCDLKQFRIELHAFFFFLNTLFTPLLYFYPSWSCRRKVSQLDEENWKYFRFIGECIFTGEWPSTYVQIHHWYTLHYFFHYFLCEGKHSIFLLFIVEKWF